MGRKFTQTEVTLGSTTKLAAETADTTGKGYTTPGAIWTWIKTLLGGDDKIEVREALEIDEVDNTSDENKPISTAAQEALDQKADAEDVDGVVKWTPGGDAEPFNTVSGLHLAGAPQDQPAIQIVDVAGIKSVILSNPNTGSFTISATEEWITALQNIVGLGDYQKKRVPAYIESGANYDITPADSGDWLKLTHSADFTATLTEDEGWAWDPEADVITITNVSASYNLTIQPGSGVSLYGAALTDPTSGSGVLVLPPFASAQVASSGDSEFIVI